MGKGGSAYLSSWKKNPLENIATGGNVALYKGTTAGLGIKGPTSTSMGIPELLPGAQKVKGFEMPQNLQEAEMQMIQRQAAIAAGQAPSVAQSMFNQNLDQASRQAMALAASQRGASNPMLAFRQAQMMNQQNALEGAQQGAILGEQERRSADQMIGAQAAAQRGVALQQSLANQNAMIQQRAQNLNTLSSVGQGAASFAMASDENAKENIKPADNVAAAVAELMKHIKPSEYEYKDEKHGAGKKVGVMAQDLEKSKIGKTMVDESPDGTKMVDTNKAIGALLAASAEMHKKIQKLEKKA